MTRIGVISNRHSFGNRRGVPTVRDTVAGRADALHAEIDTVGALRPVLADFARRDVGLIAVNAGDGTVQAVMTHLLNGSDFARPPALAVLPAGRTNLIAHDVGLEGRPAEGLARLLARNAAGEPVARIRRPVLSMRLADDAPPTHGMFFGTAAFYHGLMLGRAKFHPVGAEGPAVVGLSLGLALARALFRVRGENGIFRGDAMTIEVDGEVVGERSYFLVMATTLERLLLGLRPFWGGGRGAIRYTSAAFPPPRLGRALVPMLRGRPRPWMADSGYDSRRVDRIALRLNCPIVFDGQIVTPDPDVPVVLSGDRRIEFARC